MLAFADRSVEVGVVGSTGLMGSNTSILVGSTGLVCSNTRVLVGSLGSGG